MPSKMCILSSTMEQKKNLMFFFYFRRRLSEASRPKLKSLIAKVAGNLSKFVKAQKEAKSTTSKSDIDTEKESNSDSKETAKCDENDNKKDDSDAEGEMSMINFIDPMIIKLKEANVRLDF